MKKAISLIPEYGPLAGMRVLAAGSLIAMPFAATLLADFGAEVIEIERPRIGDSCRILYPAIDTDNGPLSVTWLQEARNRLSMGLELNLSDPDIKEIFFKLIEQSDVFMENMVWLEKLGIKDEELLEVNPRLVIVHVSGYGHKEFGGVPEICGRASYDIIGQAFSGYAAFNGNPDEPPMMTKPSLNDYVSALFAAFGTLAAYQHALKTGKGQVVDVSQFESQARIMQTAFIRYTMSGIEPPRHGYTPPGPLPFQTFRSGDNRDMAIGALSKSVYSRMLTAMNADKDKLDFDRVMTGTSDVVEARGNELKSFINSWCSERTADEIETILNTHRVPCSRVNSMEECVNHEHYLDRGNIVQYRDETINQMITAFGIAPKMSHTPGEIWRGPPSLGQDTNRILKELLDYDDVAIEKFRQKGII